MKQQISVWKPKKLKMIEGNLGKRIKPRHGPGLIKRTKYNEGSVVHGGPKVMPSIRLYNSAWEMNRTTPYDDRVVVIINIYWARPWPFSPFFDWYKASVRYRSCCPEPLAVELLSQKDYLWPIKRHIKFKLDQIDLPKDIKLFHGQSLEAVEDILKAHCDKIGTKIFNSRAIFGRNIAKWDFQ